MIFLSSIRIHGKLAINSSFVENWSYVDQIIMSCDDEVHNACIYMVLIELEEIKYAGHGQGRSHPWARVGSSPPSNLKKKKN